MMILLLNTNQSSNIFKYGVAFEYSVHNHGKIQIFVLEGGKSAGMHFLANQKQASLESP